MGEGGKGGMMANDMMISVTVVSFPLRLSARPLLQIVVCFISLEIERCRLAYYRCVKKKMQMATATDCHSSDDHKVASGFFCCFHVPLWLFSDETSFHLPLRE